MNNCKFTVCFSTENKKVLKHIFQKLRHICFLNDMHFLKYVLFYKNMKTLLYISLQDNALVHKQIVTQNLKGSFFLCLIKIFLKIHTFQTELFAQNNIKNKPEDTEIYISKFILLVKRNVNYIYTYYGKNVSIGWKKRTTWNSFKYLFFH